MSGEDSVVPVLLPSVERGSLFTPKKPVYLQVTPLVERLLKVLKAVLALEEIKAVPCAFG